MSGARDGFTLLAILIAISLTALLSFTAFQIFQQIHRSIEAAKPERTRDHTARIFLDRFARELVGAILVVKPEETDRAQFPWLFLAEDRLAEGRDNDAIRFITQTPIRAPGRRSRLGGPQATCSSENRPSKPNRPCPAATRPYVRGVRDNCRLHPP